MSRDLYLSSIVPIGAIILVRVSLCSSLAFLLVEPVTMSCDLYLSSVIPIGAILSLSLWLSNSAYIFLSVSFIQMLKALMPVCRRRLLHRRRLFKQCCDNIASIVILSILARYFDGNLLDMCRNIGLPKKR
ncbi:hypothetical protein ACFX13_019135 [Malus domestica]